MNDLEFHVFLPDIHISHGCRRSLSSVLQFLEETQPDHITQLGDLLDCYQLSTFDKDPKRLGYLREEVDLAKEFWTKIRALCPKAKLTMVQGNHEERLTRKLRQSPEYYGLFSDDWREILELDRWGVDYYPYRSRLVYHNCLAVTHGHRTGKYAGMHEMVQRGISGVSGHVHRLKMYTQSNEAGTIFWFECGFLGSLRMEDHDYLHCKPNWQQGFVAGYYVPDHRRFHLQAVPIHRHSFLWGEKLYTPPGSLHKPCPEKYRISSITYRK